MKKKKIISISLSVILLFIIISLGFIGNYFYNLSLIFHSHSQHRRLQTAKICGPQKAAVFPHQTIMRRAISSLIATRDSLTFTITFPPSAFTTVTLPPTTKPRSSRCFLISGLPPIFFIVFSSPIPANINGIISLLLAQ